MPELPEVENVCRDLSRGLGVADSLADLPSASNSVRIEKIKLMRADLRDPIPKKKLQSLEGARILGVTRRAKYILVHTENGILLSHLGMTGMWRFEKSTPVLAKHDHCVVELSGGRCLVYRDPRRFGVIDFLNSREILTHKRLCELGPEPLTPAFTADWLRENCGHSTATIKALLMNQQVVVGVGNIYASEALYLAKVSPRRRGKRVKPVEFEKIVTATQSVLELAIAGGGSSIRDYRRVGSESGKFQDSHQVYDRGTKPCLFCQTPIRRIVIVGRSTFFCPKCQT